MNILLKITTQIVVHVLVIHSVSEDSMKHNHHRSHYIIFNSYKHTFNITAYILIIDIIMALVVTLISPVFV